MLLLALSAVAASGAVPRLLIPASAVSCVILLAVIVDSRLAPGKKQLDIERRVDEVISVGQRTPVTVVARARKRVRHVWFRDQPPLEFDVTGNIKSASLPYTMEYTVAAKRRGEYRFGDVVVRANGPWGLGWRQTTVAQSQAVSVNADLSAISTYQALARRGQLAEMGVRTVKRRGEGTEFERIREAVPDDPLRSINWRATARTGRLMAVDLIPERAQPVIIALDHGRLMGVGAGAMTKLDHAINAAVLLANVCIDAGDRLGLFAFADRVSTQLPPMSGRMQMTRFLDAVRPLRASDIETDYDHALLRLSQTQKRRALIAIFTDVADPDQINALARQCARLRRRHLPLVIAVKDPAVADMATAQPNDESTMYARAVAAESVLERSRAMMTLRAAGAETIDADARTLSPSVVNRYLELKRSARV